MQAQAGAWSAESFITNMQPDFIPLRDKRRDPYYQSVAEQYNANTFDMAAYLSLKEPWANSQGKESTIAVIDIAFDLSHPALKQTQVKHSWDIDFDKPGATPEHNANYEHHGNSIAGVIWSRPRLLQPDLDPYAKGVAWGIAPAASMVALKMQRPWTSAIIRALAQAEKYQADVINISWLLPVVAEPIKRYLAYLTTAARDGTGISVVAAANPQPGVANVGLPLLPNIITVTSTDHQNQLANSSWDQNVDIAAVSYILSVSEQNGLYYQRFSKTSASAPVISGFVALLRAKYPTLTAQEIEQLLRRQCEHRQQRNISYCAFSAQKVLNSLADPGKNKAGTQLQVIKSKEQSF